MELKDRIAASARRRGLTQEQLGELLGVTRQAVSKWESGQTSPDAATLAALCEKLCVSADYILLGKEPEARQSARTAYEMPDTCPCCGRKVDGTVCPVCGYPLPAVPPRGPRYAVLSESLYYHSDRAAPQLEQFCGMSREQAKAMLETASAAHRHRGAAAAGPAGQRRPIPGRPPGPGPVLPPADRGGRRRG